MRRSMILSACRSSVEDVAHHVQVVHGQALDERGQRADEVVRAAGVHDGVDDALVVGQAAVSRSSGLMWRSSSMM